MMNMHIVCDYIDTSSYTNADVILGPIANVLIDMRFG
jgi:hypothetical protein